ncbi:ribosome-recycling factor, mitochondrial [Spea bombifrons]|uniref:ribosome-recycling factor, mitochondrial n=1 Tax=Spea bombifrons TaxID=233779 RepID=UPI0023495CA6|nr:ribosome-recycling factor, mitochondrial [Spea bombifrons]XP_053328731.1 ribosome-recycling factor, mitochondrial [Spea bombifrons]
MALRCLRNVTPMLLQLRSVGVAELPVVQCHKNPHITFLSRHLATKKSKTKSKAQSQTRININSSLVEDIINLEDVKQEMRNVVDNLKEDFNKNLSIRTSTGAFDHINVTTKDGKFPLNQLGQISLKSPQLFIINMAAFPESAAAAVNALRDSRMNLNPELDGTIIRVPVPQVTREHRENLCKLAKQLTNKAKDSLRRARSNAIVEVKKSKGEVSEDTIKLLEKQIQQIADDIAAEMDKQLAAKTKELLN